MDPIEGIDPNRLTMQASQALYAQVASRESMFPTASSGLAAPFATDLADSLSLTPPPPGASPGDLTYFFDKMRRIKQQAIAEAVQRGYRPRPTDPTAKPGDQQKAGGAIAVRAHGYYEGSQFVPVQEIRIWEVNNYRNRTYNSFKGDWPDQDLSLGRTTVGKNYRVQVTWASGVSETRDVTMDNPSGENLDFYKY